MTYLHELEPRVPQTAAELLRMQDPDPYGYMAQAAAFLDWMPSYDKNEAYGVVANFASDTDDPNLLKACLNELDAPGRWRVFAHEMRYGRTTLGIEEIVSMSEAAVTYEMAPEADRDWLALSSIYASQLEIALHGGMGIEDPIERFSLATSRFHDVGGDTYKTDRTRRDVVHMLLLAGLTDPAAELAAGFADDSPYQREYEQSLPLYQRRLAGKTISLKQRTEANKEVFRAIEAEAHTGNAVRPNEIQHDVASLLWANEAEQARQLYDKTLEAGNVKPLGRLKMALSMRSLRSYEGDDEHELLAEVAGLAATVKQIEGGTSDIKVDMSYREAISEQVISLCDKIGELPFSSRRIDLTLDVAGLRKSALQDSKLVAEHCDKLLFDTWRRAVGALTIDSAEGVIYEPQIRELWWQMRDVGFNFRKLKEMDSLFAEYSHPKFSPRSSKSSAS